MFACTPSVSRLTDLAVLNPYSGASYCDVGYDTRSPHPTPENPLGVDFPGITYCEPGKPNWVGHLVLQTNARRDQAGSLLVYDYGVGGDRADGVGRQVREQFIPSLASKPEWAPWTSGDTLFVTWVGINDCAVNTRALDPVSATQASIAQLFAAQEEVYQAGGRNFCLVDVPPTYKFPNRTFLTAYMRVVSLLERVPCRSEVAQGRVHRADVEREARRGGPCLRCRPPGCDGADLVLVASLLASIHRPGELRISRGGLGRRRRGYLRRRAPPDVRNACYHRCADVGLPI